MNHTRRIIRVNGTEQPLEQPQTISQLCKLIDAQGTDHVNLRDPGQHVMLVDDMAVHKRLPVNEKATAFYWSICIPGTKHMIRGDVVIAPDHDFGSLV